MHDVVGYRLVVADDVLVYHDDVHVLGGLVRVDFVAKFVQEEGVHVVVPLPVGIGVLASGQKSLKQRKSAFKNVFIKGVNMYRVDKKLLLCPLCLSTLYGAAR